MGYTEYWVNGHGVSPSVMMLIGQKPESKNELFVCSARSCVMPLIISRGDADNDQLSLAAEGAWRGGSILLMKRRTKNAW